jgi:hypothetical protein
LIAALAAEGFRGAVMEAVAATTRHAKEVAKVRGKICKSRIMSQ